MEWDAASVVALVVAVSGFLTGLGGLGVSWWRTRATSTTSALQAGTEQRRVEVETLCATVMALDNRVKTLTLNIERLEKENRSLETELDKAASELRSLRADLEQATGRILALEGENQRLEQELDKATARIRVLEAENERLRMGPGPEGGGPGRG